jgi:hypothetical protein
LLVVSFNKLNFCFWLQQNMAAAEWRVVADNDYYEVSNHGDVRNRATQRVLVPAPNQEGYLHVSLYRDGQKSTRRIHKMVATAFLGDSEGREIDHVDRNQTNNHISNLRYTTRSQNNLNRASHKGHQYGFVDELPGDAIVVEQYGIHHFENLHYCNGTFYLFNELQYRVLIELTPSNQPNQRYVIAKDPEGRNVKISIAKYRAMINDL